MENKKYLDKVIGSLVRGTKIDYVNKRFSFPFFHFFLSFSEMSPSNFFITSSSYFVDHCIHTFGLTDDEADELYYVYQKFVESEIKKNRKWD